MMSGKPNQLDIVDLKELREECQSFIDDLDAGNGGDEDFVTWIYEAALTAIYGKGAWDWINERADF